MLSGDDEHPEAVCSAKILIVTVWQSNPGKLAPFFSRLPAIISHARWQLEIFGNFSVLA